MTSKNPHFIDRCGHEKNAYIGSFSVFKCRGKERHYDLYVFETKYGQEVCIRYCNEGSEYISPGDLSSFLGKCESSNIVYRKASELLFKNGVVKYERRKTTTNGSGTN